MVSSTRLGINIQTSWVALRGVNHIEWYGPFDTLEEAVVYCGINFPDDTMVLHEIRKEIVTHGQET